MFKIIEKEKLNAFVTKMVVEAPLVAKKAEPGQFVILRVNENGERIPLTIADFDQSKGTITIIFQIVRATTQLLDAKQVGESIQDFVGPLGKPTELDGFKKVCVIGGGVGNAIALPIVKKCHESGMDVTSIVGFRNKDIVILEKEFEMYSNRFIITTDDGSFGRKGNVTEPLKEMLENGETFDCVFAIGPLVMMKYVCITTKPFNIKTIVSMNPIMIDGTGMCGGCRLTVDSKTKFACVDGPDFDGHLVDFDEALMRNNIYKNEEKKMFEQACNLLKKEVQ